MEGSRHAATGGYTDLDPRSYRFRVTASNNSGVWNEAGATLDSPSRRRTTRRPGSRPPFRAAVLAALGAVSAAAPSGRAGVQPHWTRASASGAIARELHDTMLQTFHGLLLRFQTALYLLPDRPAEAKEKLAGAIDHAAKAITEGRMLAQGSRRPPPSKRTTSLRRSARWEENAWMAAASDRHSTWPSKARRESSIRFFVTRSTRLLRRHFGMPSGTRMPDGSRSRSATTPSNCACACVTMVRGSIRRCSQNRVGGTLRIARGRQNVRQCLQGDWRCGAKSAQGRRWSCAFLPTSPTRHPGGGPGCHGCWLPRHRHSPKRTRYDRQLTALRGVFWVSMTGSAIGSGARLYTRRL